MKLVFNSSRVADFAGGRPSRNSKWGSNDAVLVSISCEQNNLGLFVCICSHSYSVHQHFWLPLEVFWKENFLVVSWMPNVIVIGRSELLPKSRPSLDITCKRLTFDSGKLLWRCGRTKRDGFSWLSWPVYIQSCSGIGQIIGHTSNSLLVCPLALSTYSSQAFITSSHSSSDKMSWKHHPMR